MTLFEKNNKEVC